MRIFHISDLHIGKQLYRYSLREEQAHILQSIIAYGREYKPDVLVIAGDIYDKAAPSAEAYDLFNQFLNDLSELTERMPVLVIAGNHDNGARLQYASDFLERSRIYVSAKAPSEGEALKQIVLQDDYGPVHFYLLPFIRPRDVRHLFDEGAVTSYDSAVQAVLEREQIDYSQRNVLVAHQFFVAGETAPVLCESEQSSLSVGGIDSVDVGRVQQFDYVALGHIHGPQKIGGDHIRYSGTPLKYSVSEARHQKGVTLVTLGEKGAPPQIELLPLTALRDVRTLQGTLAEVLAQAEDAVQDDYVSVTLTDEEPLYRPKDQLEERYHRILEVRLDNRRIRQKLSADLSCEEHLQPFEAFQAFYQEMNGQPLSGEEGRLMADIIAAAAEEVQ